MDEFHKKILELELKVSQVRQYPPQLISCLKFKKLFDDDDPKDTVASRKKGIQELKDALEGYLSWDQDFEMALAEVRGIADGNAAYFDDLMSQYDIDKNEVHEILGPGEHENDILKDPSLGNEGHADDEDTFELMKNNLHEFSRFNDYHPSSSVHDRESPL